MVTCTSATSAEPGTLFTWMPSFIALISPSVARVNGVAVTPEGVVASATPTNRARTATPTATSKVVRFIIYPSRRGRYSSELRPFFAPHDWRRLPQSPLLGPKHRVLSSRHLCGSWTLLGASG